MSLNETKAQAKKEVENILTDMLTREETSISEFADRLIDVLENWIKQASIKYVSGLTAPNGPVTGVFTGNIE